MKKNRLFLSCLAFYLCSPSSVLAQSIDRFGLSLGATYAQQLWLSDAFSSMDENIVYKPGFMVFGHLEKDLKFNLSLRAEMGYLQKGFRQEIDFISSDNNDPFLYADEACHFHNLAIDLSLKWRPLKQPIAPYLLLGLRNDYRLAYNELKAVEEGSNMEVSLFEPLLSDMNRYNLGALIGLGVDLNQKFFLELEYNPNLSHNIKEGVLAIKDECWTLGLGYSFSTD